MNTGAPNAVQPGQMQALKVLLVDDDPAMVELIARNVRRLGGECQSAQGLEQILDVIGQWQPSHIILDLFMPGLNGMDITHALAEARIDIPVILTSGTDKRLMEAVARSARTHGLTVSALLSKPFTRARLAASLGQSVIHELSGTDPAAPVPQARRFRTAELAAAIRDGEIQPLLQPQIACADQRLIGFEALARWHHPQHGVIGPNEFIPQAEAECLIEALPLSLLDQTLPWLASASAHPAATLAINIAPSLLEGDGFVQQLRLACDRHAIAPHRIILEVTESAKLSQDLPTLDRMTGLRLDGFGLSIDDFGIGYSSLLQLAHLPFSEIKIDRSFVSSVATSEESRVIIASIMLLAKKLGMNTVAEGVEDKATFDQLRLMGCHSVQGYYFARPLPPQAAQTCPAIFGDASRISEPA